VEACVSVPPGVFSDRYIYLQDATGGIQVYLSSRVGDFPAMRLGDRVAVHGRIAKSGMERQIDLQDAGAIQVRGGCGAIAPTRFTIDRISKNDFGSLIEISGNVVSINPPYEFAVSDASGEILIYIDATTRLRMSQIARGQSVRVIGIVSQSRNRLAVLPRYAEDIAILQNVATPTRTATNRTPTATRTLTQVSLVTVVPTPSRTVTVTPTARVSMRPTIAPVEPPAIKLDGEAFALAGAATFSIAGLGLWSLALIVWHRHR
jgi:uncharacterized protein YdeI (BOF family)